MSTPSDCENPITGLPGKIQSGVDPNRLRPSRDGLVGRRLNVQRQLLLSGQQRFTPIVVSRDGVIIDGHHAVRAAAEGSLMVDVLVRDFPVTARGDSILALPLR